MPPPTDDNDSANGRPPSERSPLLGQQKQTSPHGEPEAHEEDAPDEAPTVETPPNPKLAVIMGSLYLGGFVAAMGTWTPRAPQAAKLTFCQISQLSLRSRVLYQHPSTRLPF